MVQASGRFSIGFVVGAAFAIVLFFFARSFFLTTIQTPESEPHYEVLYAGLSSEAAVAIIGLLPVALGLISTSLIKRKLPNWGVAAAVIIALLLCLGIAVTFHTIIGDALWIGMN